MTGTDHGNGVAHGVTRRRHEDGGQQQDGHGHQASAGQRLGHGQGRDIKLEVVQRLGQIDGTAQLIVDAGTAQQGKPDHGGHRRHHRHRQNHLPDGASTRNPSDEDRHQRAVADKPGKEEHRPPLHPPVRCGLGGHGRHLEERAQIGARPLGKGIGQKQRRSQDKDRRSDRQSQKHVEAAEDLDPLVDSGDRRGHVHHPQSSKHHQLGAVAFTDTEQLMKTEADLSRQETDGADGTRHHGDHAQSVDQATEGPLHDLFAQHRIQQGPRLQRLSLDVVGMSQHHRRQRTQHGPGQQPPVHERLGQSP